MNNFYPKILDSKLNKSNLRKHYFISNELSPLTNPNMDKNYFQDIYNVLHDKYNENKDNIFEFLEEEKHILDELIEVIEKTHDSEIDHDLWEKDIELENVCRQNSILFEKF